VQTSEFDGAPGHVKLGTTMLEQPAGLVGAVMSWETRDGCDGASTTTLPKSPSAPHPERTYRKPAGRTPPKAFLVTQRRDPP